MSPKVIVSNVAKHHAYEAAIALQKEGWLKAFYTGFYSKKEMGLLQKILVKVMPNSLRKKMSNRRHDDIDGSKVKSYFLAELLERTPLRNITGKEKMYYIKGEIYDRSVSMSDLKCDVFHGFETCSLYSMRKAKALGAKIVLDEAMCHEAMAREIMTEEYERNGFRPPDSLNESNRMAIRKREEYKQADFIITCADFVRDDFVKKRGFRSDSVFAIPLGVNTKRFKPAIKKDNIFRIISVGSVGFRKGMVYLLEAFKQLNLQNAELLIISPIEDDFKLVMHKYEGIYKYIESVPNQDLVKYYTNSSVFVLPSVLDSFGFVTAEAMASGIPVIVTENCGFRGRDGVDGFTVPIRNVEALEEKILLLYHNEKTRQEMGMNASDYVKQFTWERYHKAVIHVYKSILGDVENG